jgi:hypothetical protein
VTEIIEMEGFQSSQASLYVGVQDWNYTLPDHDIDAGGELHYPTLSPRKAHSIFIGLQNRYKCGYEENNFNAPTGNQISTVQNVPNQITYTSKPIDF